MLYVEVMLIGLAAFGLCFFLGKKLGERKFRRVNEEMKALELSFNQLLEQMELTSAHNLKVLEAKTEDLRQLLPIVDKKVLQAQDLTQQLHEYASRKPAVAAPSSLDPAREIKLRRELQESIATVQNRLSSLEQRLQGLEHRATEWDARVEASSHATNRSGARMVPVADLPFSATGSEKVIDIKSRELRREREGVGQMTSEMTPTLESIVRQAEKQLKEVQQLREMTAVVAGDTRRLEPVAAPEAEFSPLPSELPEELTGEDVPAPGTLFYDVLTLSQQGVTIPQIARKMNIGNGEVELIMKLYGSRFNLRKVM